jgi:precorrin-3B synthase
MLPAMSISSGEQTGPGVRGRADACPGAVRLHEAADGFLGRVRVPGGRLSLAQAGALGAAAARLGDGHLELTSRGNVQLRGLGRSAGAELAGLLQSAGLLPSLDHDRARNVVASPLSGLDGRGRLDISPWIVQLDEILCATRTLADLGGRFLIGLDDGRGDVAALRPDVTVVAGSDGTAWLRLGDVDQPVTVPAAAAPRLAAQAAEAFLAVRHDLGSDAWRVLELPDAPRRMVRWLEDAGVATSTTPRHTPAPHDPDPPQLGVVRGLDGRTSLSVLSRLGRVTADQWRTVAAVAALGGRSVRLTPWRGVVLPHVPGASADDLLAELGAAGFVTRAWSPWAGATACAGRPGCGRSLTDVRHDASVALAAAPSARQPLPVHWSGCERRCGHPSTIHVEVVAGERGYHVGLSGQENPAVDSIHLADAVSSARSTP